MKEFFEKIKRAVKIEDVLIDRGITPSRNYGNKLIYKCPIHSGDNSPSFYVYKKDSGDDFFCYGCKAGGNVIQLVKQLNNCSNTEAVKIVSGISGFEIDPYFFTHDIDFSIDFPEMQEESLDSIIKDITIAFRAKSKLKVISDLELNEEFWFSTDDAYRSGNMQKLKENLKWILGK
jgi:hypothetical protein